MFSFSSEPTAYGRGPEQALLFRRDTVTEGVAVRADTVPGELTRYSGALRTMFPP
jgi:hypothetical protein